MRTYIRIHIPKGGGLMFLQSKKSKGICYIYLYEYSNKENYCIKKHMVHSFGRVDKALKNMVHWRNNFNEFPGELISLGCDLKDLNDWIRTLKTGVTKTGKRFKSVI